MRTDLEVCREVAAHVEDGTMQDAVVVLATMGMVDPDPTAYDKTREKPVLKVDLKGEDGNAYFLVARAIHRLVKVHRELSACAVLTSADSESYADLVELVRQYVRVEE